MPCKAPVKCPACQAQTQDYKHCHQGEEKCKRLRWPEPRGGLGTEVQGLESVFRGAGELDPRSVHTGPLLGVPRAETLSWAGGGPLTTLDRLMHGGRRTSREQAAPLLENLSQTQTHTGRGPEPPRNSPGLDTCLPAAGQQPLLVWTLAPSPLPGPPLHRPSSSWLRCEPRAPGTGVGALWGVVSSLLGFRLQQGALGGGGGQCRKG